MSGQNHWERQRREIDSCNIFYSSFGGIESGPGLADIGFTSPVRFPVVPIRGRTNNAEPDFATFNGSTLLLAEVKAGKNLSDRYSTQLERCNAVSIEDGQNFIRNSDHLRRQGFDHNELTNIDTCIIFIEDRYEEHIDNSYNDIALTELESHGPILTQGRGSELRIARGEFNNDRLNNLLDEGIPLPNIPPTAVFLNEGVEKESLAVSICYDHVIPELKHGAVELSTTDIDDIYPQRSINTQNIIDVMKFLEEIGACEQIGPRQYQFDKQNQKNILHVNDIVSEQRVDVYMNQISDDQSQIDNF